MQSLHPSFLPAILVSAALAGCIGAAESGVCPEPYVDDDGVNVVEPDARIIPLEADPWSFDATNYRSCTMDKVGWNPLRLAEDGSPDPHRYIGEMDMRGDLGLGAVAVLGSGERPAFYILDISDRAAPQVLSYVEQDITYLVDVKFTEDGKYLITASQNRIFPRPHEVSGADPTDPGSLVETPEDPTTFSTPSGFTVYDISDPSEPFIAHSVTNQDDLGCHMLETINNAPDFYSVMCVGQFVKIYGLQEIGGRLVDLGAPLYYIPNDRDGEPCIPTESIVNGILGVPDVLRTQCSSPHDMTVTRDADGRTYMAVSHWHEGVKVVDITDAPQIAEVGQWRGAGAQHYKGFVHTANMFNVGEDRYIIATPEYSSDAGIPVLWVLDANDLSDIRLVAEWTYPELFNSRGLGPNNFYMTLHQWQAAPTGPDATQEEVKIYITWNHNGVWALDFADILAGNNEQAIHGFHMSRLPLEREEEVSNAVLSTWDVGLVDGHIYGSDRATGLWVFHLQGDALGDPRLTGFN